MTNLDSDEKEWISTILIIVLGLLLSILFLLICFIACKKSWKRRNGQSRLNATDDRNQRKRLLEPGLDAKNSRRLVHRLERQNETMPRVGSHGDVYEWIGHNPRAVVKYLRIQRNRDAFLLDLRKWHKLDHLNIVKLLQPNFLHGQDGILIEYCLRGTLRQLLFDPTIIYTMKTVLLWGQQLFSALEYLFRQQQIIHQDIKPENIFVTENYLLKIGDFGFIKVYTQNNTETLNGTQRYASPPKTDPNKKRGTLRQPIEELHKNDVYSLGLVMWEIVERVRVFAKFERNGAFNRDGFIQAFTAMPTKLLRPANCEKRLQQIIARCTDFTHNRRGTAKETMEEFMNFQFEESATYLSLVSPYKEEEQTEILRPIGFDGTDNKTPVGGSSVSQSSDNLSASSVYIDTLPNPENVQEKRIVLMQNQTHLFFVGRHWEKRYVGEGAYGKVYELVGHDPPVVVKELFIKRGSFTDYRAELQKELKMQKKVDHPNVVRLIETQLENEFSIIMEYCERNTLKEALLNQNLIYTMNTVVTWAICLFDALNYMYQKSIIHRDIKPTNIFVTKDFTAKLGDFGMAKVIKGTCTKSCAGGTRRYMNPPQFEEINGIRQPAKKVDSHKNDVYALGLVLWEIVERRTVFVEFDQDEDFDRDEFVVRLTIGNTKKLEAPHCQQELQDAIASCTLFDYNEREVASVILAKLTQIEAKNLFISELPFMPIEETLERIIHPIGFDGTMNRVQLENRSSVFVIVPQ